jgi:hypothetical protein
VRADFLGLKLPEGLGDDVEAEQQQVAADPRLDDVARDGREHVGADDRPDDSRQQQAAEQRLADVAKGAVRQRRRPGGETLGGMHGGAGGDRRHPDAHQQAGGGDPVGHAQRSVDQLREKTRRKKIDQILGHMA